MRSLLSRESGNAPLKSTSTLPTSWNTNLNCAAKKICLKKCKNWKKPPDLCTSRKTKPKATATRSSAPKSCSMKNLSRCSSVTTSSTDLSPRLLSFSKSMKKPARLFFVPSASPKNASAVTESCIASQEGRRIQVASLVEKPKPEEAPSNYGIIGKYICTPDVLRALEHAEAKEELRLIDGFRTLLAEGQSLYALEIDGTRYDTGTPFSLLEANIAFAKKYPEI